MHRWNTQWNFGRIKMIFKEIARKPEREVSNYLKYGFVVMECVRYSCPRCSSVLNAGPNYQPRYCDKCGQKVSFKGIEWEPEKELGISRAIQGGAISE